MIAAAKQYNIDPVYFLCQTILETGYGTSTLSQGKAITTVVSGSSVVRDSSENVTGFKTVNGKYKHPQFLRNGVQPLRNQSL